MLNGSLVSNEKREYFSSIACVIFATFVTLYGLISLKHFEIQSSSSVCAWLFFVLFSFLSFVKFHSIEAQELSNLADSYLVPFHNYKNLP